MSNFPVKRYLRSERSALSIIYLICPFDPFFFFCFLSFRVNSKVKRFAKNICLAKETRARL